MLTRLSAKPRLKFTSAVNLVFDGNSLFFGEGATASQFRVPDQVMALAPVAGSGATRTGSGNPVSGQTWRQMNGLDGGSTADVDGAWSAGKTNILIIWETTNSVYNGGRTGLQAAQDCADYIAARKALNPWKVVLLTTIPREQGSNQTDRDAKNAQLAAADNFMRGNYRAMGADVLCDVRVAGSPFAFASYLPSDFTAAGDVWKAGESPRIHLNDSGYSVIAGLIGSSLRRVPV